MSCWKIQCLSLDAQEKPDKVNASHPFILLQFHCTTIRFGNFNEFLLVLRTCIEDVPSLPGLLRISSLRQDREEKVKKGKFKNSLLS